MFLKSLILKGFKSFADKSTLGFEPGIAAIVGPNGSGKSNISDAVLWVLGERNAKNLRGQAMEDVIFAGSSARKSVSVAEVQLVLDNSDGTLPIDYTEVVIARKMYRSGESEYLINGAVVRRMDVLDILHDSGIGSGAHSIISQGNLDAVLRSRPEDRRELIEEAAGILKHKQRKAKSEKKLSHMETHLTRVHDISSEVERQLKPLERKAKRAQAYQELSQELAEISLQLAVDDLRKLQNTWDEHVKAESDLNENIDESRDEIRQAEECVEQAQRGIQEQSTSVDKTAQEYRKIQSLSERFDSLLVLLQERKRALGEYMIEHEQTYLNYTQKQEYARVQSQETSLQLKTVEQEHQTLSEVIDALSETQLKRTQELEEIETHLQTCAVRLEECLKQRDESQFSLSQAQELLSDSLAQNKLLEKHTHELSNTKEKAQQDYNAAQKIHDDSQSDLKRIEREESKARLALGTLTAKRDDLQERCESAREEVALFSSEHKALQEYERALTSSNPALQWALDRESEFSLSKLSDLIKAPSDLESAIENYLKNDIRALVSRDIEHTHDFSQQVSENNTEGDLVVFFDHRAESAAQAETLDGTGLTPLLDLISIPSDHASIAANLFAGVFVADTKEHALNQIPRLPYHASIITRDGICINGAGRMALSVGTNNQEGTLARSRKIQEALKKKDQAQKNFEHLSLEKEEVEKAFRKAQGESLRLAQELAEVRGRAESAQADFLRAGERIEVLAREENTLSAQLQEVTTAIEQAQPITDEFKEKIEALEREIADLRIQEASLKTDRDPVRAALAAVGEQISEHQLKHAGLSERITYLKRIIQSRIQENEQIEHDLRDLDVNRSNKKRALLRVDPLIESISQIGQCAKLKEAQMKSLDDSDRKKAGVLHETLQEARRAARSAQMKYDELNEKASLLRVEKGRLEIRVEAAVNSIVAEYSTPLEEALKMDMLNERVELEEQAGKLGRRITNMGSINPDAAAEYEELKNRFEYLQEQVNDLQNAQRALQKIIKVLDERMNSAFVETFEQVNENFSNIFESLFPGGNAELTLVDPENPQSSGIEVSAQPRGKRITKMTLMSGGEKSLTALALLFAIYHIRSTPFYILDEVEAALDDSNLRRLCSYLESLRSSTQLILITHQRRTMELADVLYGISMQADGVTRVVSQKIEHAKEAR